MIKKIEKEGGREREKQRERERESLHLFLSAFQMFQHDQSPSCFGALRGNRAANETKRTAKKHAHVRSRGLNEVEPPFKKEF